MTSLVPTERVKALKLKLDPILMVSAGRVLPLMRLGGSGVVFYEDREHRQCFTYCGDSCTCSA